MMSAKQGRSVKFTGQAKWNVEQRDQMGASFVTVSGNPPSGLDHQTVRNGIWVNDSILQLLLRLLALHLPEPSPGAEGDQIRAIRDQWLLASGISFPGSVPHDLEAIAKTQFGISVIRSALSSLISALDGMPLQVSGQMYSVLGLGEAGAIAIQIDELRSTTGNILNLLDVA